MKIKYTLYFTICIICCCFPLKSESALVMDLYGIYIGTGDEGDLTGGGITLSSGSFFDRYTNDINLYFSLYAAGSVENKDEPTEETRLFIPAIIGLRYMYPAGILPLRYEFSAGAGPACMIKQGPEKYGAFIDPSDTRTDTGFGPSIEVLAGINYRLNQNVAFFLNGGYHFTKFYSDYIASNASGFQLSFGIRMTLSGKGKELDVY